MPKKLHPITWKDVYIQSGFWEERQRINREKSIPAIYKNSIDTGRIDLLNLNWSVEKNTDPHHFWDSDNGKMIEAAAYSLAHHPDSGLEKQMDDVIDLMETAQQADGYLNSYFTLFCPEKRFTDMMIMHELYCAGHLAEAAVAYFQSTGKRKLLDVICRYVDFIDSRIGKDENKMHGYDGHPEIELALVRLSDATGNAKYNELAKYLVDERGTQPYYFELEARRQGLDLTTQSREINDIGSFLVDRLRGEKKDSPDIDPMVVPKKSQPRIYKDYLKSRGPFAQYLSHKPVRQQDEPVGHAVRAMYLYCAMADLAAEDETLKAACETLWKSLVTKQLYITGGIGQSQECERFSYAYDLPNESNYSETCASIGLAMWAHRMLQLDADAQYADIIERTLYNGVLSGVAASGDKFFYANYMAMYPDQFKHASTVITKPDRLSPERRQWFSCACCPANLTRLIASVGGYMYSSSRDGVYIHLYGDSTTCFPIGDSKITLSQHGNYPWSGDIQIHIDCEKTTQFGLALRIPGWCRNYLVKLNGQPVEGVLERGYLNIRRQWNPGDIVRLLMDMPVMKIEANPKVRQDCGRIALQRGPLVYCLEEADNYPDLNDFVLQYNHGIDVENSHLFGGIIILKMSGTVTDRVDWDDTLYRDHRSQRVEAQATAIPYYLWANRGMGEMIVWVRAE